MAISSRTDFKSENVKKKSKLNELRARKLPKNIKNLKKQIFGPLFGNNFFNFNFFGFTVISPKLNIRNRIDEFEIFQTIPNK